MQRRRSSEDERARMISVTSAGMALREPAAEIPTQLACSLGLSASRGKQLKRLCEELLEAVENRAAI